MLMFKLKESEVLIPRNMVSDDILNTAKVLTPYAGKNFVSVVPAESTEKFGEGFYDQITFLDDIRQGDELNCSQSTVTFPELRNIDVTTTEEAEVRIGDIRNIIDVEGK